MEVPPPQPKLPPGAQFPVKPPAAPQRPSIDVAQIHQTINIGAVKQAARISSLAPKLPASPKPAMVVKPVGVGMIKQAGGVLNPNMKVTQGKIKKETMRISLPPKPGAGAPMSALPLPKSGPVSSETAALGVTRPLGAPKVKPPSGPVQTQMVEGLIASKAPPAPKPLKPFFAAKPVAPTEKIKPATMNFTPKGAAPAGMPAKQPGFQFDTAEAPTALIPQDTATAQASPAEPAAAAVPRPAPAPAVAPAPMFKPAAAKPITPIFKAAAPAAGPAIPQLPVASKPPIPAQTVLMSPEALAVAQHAKTAPEKTGPSGKTTSVPLPSVALKSSPDDVKARTSLLKPPPKIPAVVPMTANKAPSGPLGSPQAAEESAHAVPQGTPGSALPTMSTQPLMKPKPPVPIVPAMGKAPPPQLGGIGGPIPKRPTTSLSAGPVPTVPATPAMNPMAPKQIPQMPKTMAAPQAPVAGSISSMPTIMTPHLGKPAAPTATPVPAMGGIKPPMGAKPAPQAPKPPASQVPTTLLPDQAPMQPRPMPMMMAPASDGMSNTLALVAALCALAGLGVVLAGFFDVL